MAHNFYFAMGKKKGKKKEKKKQSSENTGLNKIQCIFNTDLLWPFLKDILFK